MNAAISLKKLVEGLGEAVSGPSLMRMRLKFLAWWNGDEYDEAAAERAIAERFSNYRSQDGGAAKARDHLTDRYRAKLQDMSNRLQVAELLWGPGYVGPSDPEWHADLIRPMALTGEHNLAVVGSGLAGHARDFVGESDVWVTAYERRKDVAAAAREQCAHAGLAKKVVIEDLPPIDFALPENKYQGLVSLFETNGVPDKAELFRQAAASLKKKKAMLIVDYVAAEKHASLPDSFSSYWGPVELWTEDQYKDAITEAGFDLRVSEDITDSVLKMIATAWADWEKVVARIAAADLADDDRSALLRILSEEAQLWAARQEALKHRRLLISRFFGIKKK